MNEQEIITKLEVTKEQLRDLVNTALQCSSFQRVPLAIEGSLFVVGVFRMMQLACELDDLIHRSRRAIRRMDLKLSYPEQQDGWIVLKYDFSEVYGQLDIVRARITRDCVSWNAYMTLGTEVYSGLDQFCGEVAKISQGYEPGSLSREPTRFHPEPTINEFADQAVFYRRAIENVLDKFPGWILQVAKLCRKTRQPAL